MENIKLKRKPDNTLGRLVAQIIRHTTPKAEGLPKAREPTGTEGTNINRRINQRTNKELYRNKNTPRKTKLHKSKAS